MKDREQLIDQLHRHMEHVDYLHDPLPAEWKIKNINLYPLAECAIDFMLDHATPEGKAPENEAHH